MNVQLENEQRRWFREPYVWLVISLPLSAVIGGIVTTWLAIQSWDGLVVDDYYKRGLEINRTLERDRAADRLGLTFALLFETGSSKARVRLTGNDRFTPPDRIDISFLHSTRGGFDKHARLVRIAPDLYETDMPELIRGTWYILLEAQNWRLLESIRI